MKKHYGAQRIWGILRNQKTKFLEQCWARQPWLFLFSSLDTRALAQRVFPKGKYIKSLKILYNSVLFSSYWPSVLWSIKLDWNSGILSHLWEELAFPLVLYMSFTMSFTFLSAQGCPQFSKNKQPHSFFCNLWTEAPRKWGTTIRGLGLCVSEKYFRGMYPTLGHVISSMTTYFSLLPFLPLNCSRMGGVVCVT